MDTVKGWIFGSEPKMGDIDKISSRSGLKKALNECKYFNISDVERDVIEAMTSFRDLDIKVDTFVSNVGIEQRLVCLFGTIPVNYKATLYNIPICFWLSLEHPALPPLVQVQPTKDMLIKVNSTVDQAGMVDIPYLQEWDMETSDLSSLIQVLCAHFGENTPLYRKPKQRSDECIKAVDDAKSSDKLFQSGVKQSIEGDGRFSPSLCTNLEQKSPSNRRDREENTHPDSMKQKREELIQSIEEKIRKAQVLYEQTESLVNVLEIIKADLTEERVSCRSMDALEEDIEKGRKWYEKLHSNLVEMERETEDNIIAFEDLSLAERERRRQVKEKSYKEWTNDDVCLWFEAIGMNEFVPYVKRHKIRGIHLPSLSKDDFIELGVTKLGDRMTIDEEITKLCNTASNIF